MLSNVLTQRHRRGYNSKPRWTKETFAKLTLPIGWLW